MLLKLFSRSPNSFFFFTSILPVKSPPATSFICPETFLISLVIEAVTASAIPIPITNAIILNITVLLIILLVVADVSLELIKPTSVHPVTASLDVTTCTFSPLMFSSNENALS